VLAIYQPRSRKQRRDEGAEARSDVSVLEIAPAILSNFGVAVPHYMQEPAMLARAGTVRPVPASGR
jgi:hypothetical protein